MKQNHTIDRSLSKKHGEKLKAILAAFFAFLEKRPKPSDELVRSEFQFREKEWKDYCIQNLLDVRASMMFNAMVSYEWERRNAKRNSG